MQWVIAGLINLLLQFLEVSFRRRSSNTTKPSHKSDEEDFFSSETHQEESSTNDKANNDSSRAKKIQQAYAFMELEPPVTDEDLKKQYKKLCLRYHPDRNGGSEESKANFQKLRACMDWIQKDMAGVADDNNDHDDNENASNPQRQRQHHDEDSDDDDDESQDDFYQFIKKQQEAQRRYREMQEERERAMREELKRQKERTREFHQQVKVEREKCRRQKRDMGLGTDTGRMEAHEEFQQQAEETAAARCDQNSTKNQTNTQESFLGKPPRRQTKPSYHIMDCNSNEIVVALRLNMPEIVFQLMNQELPVYARKKSRELHFEGESVTSQRIKMEYMLQKLDEDSNNLLHYAVYYECYEVINMVCGTALRDDFLDKMLVQPNIHGNTPLFFAQIAEDRSILSLVEAHLKAVKAMKVQNEILPALEAGIKRLKELVRQIGISSTLDTLLSLCIARQVFAMHFTTSLSALFLTNVVHTESQYVEEVPGIHSFSVHLTFCALWKTARWVILHWVMTLVRWELLLLLAPITMVVMCSKSRTPDAADRLLYPFLLHAKLSDQVEKLLILGHRYTVPPWILRKELARSYLLILVATMSWGIRAIRV